MEKSIDFKEWQLYNIASILVKWPVLIPEVMNVSKEIQPEQKSSTVIKLEVSKTDKSIDFKEVHSKKILFILVTFDVSKPEKSISLNLEQPLNIISIVNNSGFSVFGKLKEINPALENISLISVSELVSKFDISICSKA